MELYLNFTNKHDVQKMVGKLFFEDDPHISTLRFQSQQTEYFLYDDYDGPDIRDEEIQMVMVAIHKIKEIAPSCRIAYMSKEDEGTGWIMTACSFEEEADIYELNDFCPNGEFASAEWFASARTALGLPLWDVQSSDDFLVDEHGELYEYTGLGGIVAIPEEVCSIAERVFYGCDTITELIIPDNVKKVGYEAFAFCKNLRKITLQSSNHMPCFQANAVNQCPMLIDENGFLIAGSWILQYTGAASEITIPEGVVGLGSHLFARNANIKHVVFPASLKFIHIGAFNNCRGLTEIEIPQNVERLGASAFANCANLERVTLLNPDIHLMDNVFSNCPKLAGPDGYIRINKKLFTYHGTEQHIVISNEDIGFGCAFQGNETIRSVTIPEGVEIIQRYAFSGCKNLESVQLPDSLKYIEAQAFENCISLKEIVIPNGVEAIGTSAFGGCINLVSVDMHHTTKLCASFYQCPGLTDSQGRIIICGVLDYYPRNKSKKIVIPKGVRVIEDGVLRYSENLTELHIPPSVEYIGRLFDGITIYGKPGSYAEAYANENGIPFIGK